MEAFLMYTAKRINSIGSAIFSEMAMRKQQEINKGKSVIDLSIGTPALPPSEAIIEAMRKALLEPKAFHYALDGKQELKEAIKNWYNFINRYFDNLKSQNSSSQ